MAVNVDSPLHLPMPHDLNPTPRSTPWRGNTPTTTLQEERTVGNDVTPLTFTTFQNVIDGELSSTNLQRHSLNPATLEANPEVPVCTQHDVDRAVAAAQNASQAWAEALSEAHSMEFAHIQVREMGMPLPMAVVDVHWGVQWMRDFCTFSLPDKLIEATWERYVIERYVPIGVTVGIIPWNGPIVLACGKIATALLTGNTLILKPSPLAPYGVLKLAELGLQFFPRGVLQALSGDDDLGPWLTAHPGIEKVSFIGSCATAKKVVQACSAHLKRVSAELGGNDPAIVCEDVEPVVVAQKIAKVALMRSGQFCIAIKRVYVHEPVYDAVLAGIVEYIGSRVKDLLANIEETKLTVLPRGGQLIEGLSGFFIRPIVVSNPPDDARVVVEEAFGPIIPVMKWSEEVEVIQRANNTNYGLGASVWSRDLSQADRIANKLQAGNVWINTHAEVQASASFAGHKQSGFGSEFGVEGLKGWCNVQSKYTRPL
ncbi:aldehyde dehydrogenase [Xylaria digitata]|nr:aldehyde dehydrogenase [Xylaria digitata]